MKATAILQRLHDTALLWSQPRTERITSRLCKEKVTSEEYVATQFALVCGGDLRGAANLSTKTLNAGEDVICLPLCFSLEYAPT